MGALVWLIVIGTSIWVLIDAKSIGVKKGQITGVANLGPWGWFFVCLLLWIVGFPFYLAKRGEYKRINSNSNTPQQQDRKQSSFGSDSIAQLEKLALLKEKGLVTDDEFNTKKKELLG